MEGYDPVNDEVVDPEKSWFDPQYGDPLPNDPDGHGTHTMGTIVGQEPDSGYTVGIAPGAKWIAARVFDALGYTSDAILLEAADWMLAPGGDTDAAPDVVNNSWSGGSVADDWYMDAVANYVNAEILPVFSAGNQRQGEPLPWPGSIANPASYPDAFAVGATDRNDLRASFSKLGPSPFDETIIKPEMVAPGVNVRSSLPGGVYGLGSGTSMSAPHVAGTAALLRSANQALTVADMRDILTGTARPLTDDEYPTSPNFGYGYGLLDAFEAVSQIASGIGRVEGRVLADGEDLEDAVIIHEQEITEAFMGSEIDIEARVIDDVAVTEVELLVQAQGKSYWFLVPMERVSGDHKDGVYKGTITYDMLIGDSIKYRIRARDYAGEAVITEDYVIEIVFGIVPDEYTQGFESHALGWILDGCWQWGEAVEGFDPVPYEGIGLVGTALGENYPYNSDDWLITPPIDLRDETLPAATLRFHQWYNIENNYDNGYIYVTNDYGETWNLVAGPFTDIREEWHEVVIDLTDYIGSQEPVFVGFRLVSDGIVNRPGWYIDNVRLIGEDTEAPLAPTNLVAEANIRGIKLDWDASLEGDFDHYNVYRADTSGGPYTLIAETTNNSYVDMEAVHNVEQFYVVTAVDFNGNESEYSNEASDIAVPYTQIYGSDFEEDDGGFITGVTQGTANDWEWGVPTSGPNAAASGEKLWATNLDGNYTARNDSYIESPAIELPDGGDIVLTFTHWYDFEGTTTLWDYGEVHISNDDGETWINITPRPEEKFGRREQRWFVEEISLNEYYGDTIKIRFFFHSDGSVFYSGWYVDDVYVMAAEVANEDPVDPPENPEPEPNPDPEEIARKEAYVEPSEPSFRIDREPVDLGNYEIVSDEEVRNTPESRGWGIPVDEEATVTVLETGRTVKVDLMTGKYSMNLPAGTYTLRAEAYGYYPQDEEVVVVEGETVTQSFLLQEKPKGAIAGRVVDRYWGDPAPFAEIRVVEDRKIPTVIADEEGYFTIPDVYVGTYTLSVTAENFYPGEFEVTVNPDEVTEVELGLKRFVGYEDEIVYDDGTAENALVLNSAGNGLAVRFTPERPGLVKGLRIYFWGTDWPSPGGNRLGFEIYDIVDGKPVRVGETIYVDGLVRGDWNYIDLSSIGFVATGDFFISTMQDDAGSYCPGTGIDESSPHGDRSYLNIGGEEFIPIADEGVVGALMMRAVMYNEVDTPVITNLEEVNYTNQDSITVEGTVVTDATVNVYVNNEKVASVETEDLRFAVEVDLPLDENTIMVTAEMEGNETEPSLEVVVIKDKEAPVLTVDEPEDGAKINVEVVHVVGNTSDNIEVKELLINDEAVEIDEEGNYHERLILDEGENTITVKAVDLAGNETVVERTVYVELETPEITNIEPSEDVELRAGEVLTVSFNAPAGGEGYFRLLLPFGNEPQDIGIPMEETEEGFYVGTWTVPEGVAAENIQIEVEYISPYGNVVKAIAAGKLTIVGEGVGPVITNIEPSEDVELRTGEELTVSFNAPAGGKGYFRLLLPFGNEPQDIGIPMEETEEGFYVGTWTAPEGIVASGLQVEVIFIGSDGTRHTALAEGRVTIIGDMEDLPVNAVIIGDKAFDLDYINNNPEAQMLLINWINGGNEVYIKLGKDTLVDLDGQLVDDKVLPEVIYFHHSNGNIAIYTK